MGHQRGRHKKQQKSLEKKFNKQKAAGNGQKKKDKYAAFKGKYAIKPGQEPSFD